MKQFVMAAYKLTSFLLQGDPTMDHRSARWRRAAGWVVVALLVVVLAGCAPAESFRQSTLNPKGDLARDIDHLFRITLYAAIGVFVLVEGALLFVLFKFRGRPDDPEPKQVHGNTTVEIIWTAIPALILAFIAVPTVRTIFDTYRVPKGPEVLQVEVIGHQWWWEFRYPQYGLTTANELHVPVGRPVALKMVTQDVLHSFWVPQFAGKRDVFQQRPTVLWFRAEEAGLYPGQCAEFCGIQHGRMAFQVQAEAPAEFDAYVARLKASGAPAPAPAATASAGGVTTASLGAQQGGPRAPAADTTPAAPAVDPLVAQGQQLFLAKGCIGCHSTDATKPMGIGPNLAGVGRRAYIAAGWLKNDDAGLTHWIREPQTVKTGVLMPNLGVTEDEAKALVAYLRTR